MLKKLLVSGAVAIVAALTLTGAANAATTTTVLSGPSLLVSASSGKCLDVTNGDFADGQLQQYACNAPYGGVIAADQKFELIEEGTDDDALAAVSPDGTLYYITSEPQGAQLTLSATYSAASQIVKSGNFYVLVSSGLTLDVTANSGSNGAAIMTWPDNGAANQQFTARTPA